MSRLKNKTRYGQFISEGPMLVSSKDLNLAMGLYQKWRDKQIIDLAESLYTIKEREKMSQEFITKDSGERQEFSTGMKRDVQTDKPRYDLLDMPMLKRWAELMARGAKKYGENNWKKAATQEELDRFKASALRHMFQWFEGDTTEDHGSAVFFNVAGAEMVKAKLALKTREEENIAREQDIPFRPF